MKHLTNVMLQELRKKGWAFAKLEEIDGIYILQLRRESRRQNVWGADGWDCVTAAKTPEACKTSKELTISESYIEIGKGWN